MAGGYRQSKDEHYDEVFYNLQMILTGFCPILSGYFVDLMIVWEFACYQIVMITMISSHL